VKGQENLVSTLRHGKSRRGAWAGEYYSWAAMIQRCTNPARINYHLYGARGISVCARWLNSFDAFLADMGERPEGTSLGRIDPDGNYEPGNCEWQDRRTQARTTRATKLTVEAAAAIRASAGTNPEIGRRFGVSKTAVRNIKLGRAWA
jgi:hypothetical protein